VKYAYGLAIVLQFAILLTSGFAVAETKTEIELRQRLAASETARIAMAATLGRLTAKDVAGSRQARINRDAGAAEAASAQTQADTNTATVAAAVAAAAAASAAASEAQREQTDQFQRSNDKGNLVLMITGFTTFLTVIAGLFYNGWNEGRKHRWEIEKEKASLEHRTDLLAKVGEVKEEAHAAFEEANTVNQKIASLGQKLVTDKKKGKL
jgi:hypothetical protein